MILPHWPKNGHCGRATGLLRFLSYTILPHFGRECQNRLRLWRRKARLSGIAAAGAGQAAWRARKRSGGVLRSAALSPSRQCPLRRCPGANASRGLRSYPRQSEEGLSQSPPQRRREITSSAPPVRPDCRPAHTSRASETHGRNAPADISPPKTASISDIFTKFVEIPRHRKE